MVSVAGWERFGWLRAGFSERADGTMGWTTDGELAVVAENRRRLVGEFELVTVRQVHGAVVRMVAHGMELATAEGKAVLEGDGLMTRSVGLMVGVQTADCVPVLVVDTRLRAVATIHAGWRGTAGRIAEAGVAEMQREFGSRVEDLMAAVGPSIGACCFEVGAEVAGEFDSEVVSELGGRAHVDLWEANRWQLVRAGVAEAAITVVGECTACARVDGVRKYFSYRAETGKTGRMLNVVGVVGEQTLE